MLIKLFVLHNEPVGHSLFLVNFKQAGMSEFVLTLHTPRLLSLSDFILIFSKLELFLFFSFPHIFLRHKLTQDVSESGADKKSTQILVYFWISIYRIFQSWSFRCITDRGFHLNLPWKVIELNKHFFVSICFISGFVLRELVMKRDLSLPLRSLNLIEQERQQ